MSNTRGELGCKKEPVYVYTAADGEDASSWAAPASSRSESEPIQYSEASLRVAGRSGLMNGPRDDMYGSLEEYSGSPEPTPLMTLWLASCSSRRKRDKTIAMTL